jgi:hypothetical protein
MRFAVWRAFEALLSAKMKLGFARFALRPFAMAVSQRVNGGCASCISGFENPLGSCFTLTHNTQNSDAAENSKSTLCGILN